MQPGKHLIFLLCVLFPCLVFAQEETDITGLWKGTQFNDSTQLYYRYEIGISREKKKYTGFSHTWFIINDTQYFALKKVKVRRQDGKIIVEDDGIVAYNYPGRPPKGVRQLNVLELDVKDSIMKLSGPFTTNRTREYAPVTGSVYLERKNDFWQSSLVPHMQELGIENQLGFVEESLTLKGSAVAVLIKVEDPVVANATVKAPDKTGAEIKPIAKTVAPAVNNNPVVKKELSTEVKPAVAAADKDKRTTVNQQTVYFKSDSLQLALYDNGEVDGDTVSVLLNGKLIIEKQRLATNAVRKTIFIDQQTDSVQLLMYAENLGTIAPNTGLLVVKDGRDTYEIRFSGDLQKNAAIIFRRKK